MSIAARIPVNHEFGTHHFLFGVCLTVHMARQPFSKGPCQTLCSFLRLDACLRNGGPDGWGMDDVDTFLRSVRCDARDQ